MHRTVTLILLLGLAAASIAAVFAVQRVERQGSPIGTPRVSYAFSPNGDGVRDSAELRFELRHRERVTVTIHDAKGERVATIVNRTTLRGPVRLAWPGLNEHDDHLPEGEYFLRVRLLDSERSFEVASPIRLDVTEPPIERVILDSSRMSTLHVIRARVQVRDAVTRYMEFDGKRLLTKRIRRDPAERARHSYTKFFISAQLPKGVRTRDLSRLRFVAIDRAGNRADHAGVLVSPSEFGQ